MTETLRAQVLTEVEKPFRDKLSQVDAELEKSRSDYKKLKYDYTFLKSEYEHESSEHKRIIDELTLRYEAEVSYPVQAARLLCYTKFVKLSTFWHLLLPFLVLRDCTMWIILELLMF